MNHIYAKQEIANTLTEVQERLLNFDISLFGNDGVLCGRLSYAYYNYSMYLLSNNGVYLNKLQDIINGVFSDIENGQNYIIADSTLCDGLAGFGFLLAQLYESNIIGDEISGTLNVFSELSYSCCLKMIEESEFDFFYGAYGLLLFLLDYKQYEYCKYLLNKILLYAQDNNYLFYNRNEQDTYTRGLNYGFAHGILALLNILGDFYKNGIEVKLVKDLLTKTISSVDKFSKDNFTPSKYRFTNEQYIYPSFYPYNIYVEGDNSKPMNFAKLNNGIFHFTNRLGWCNSDLGFGFTLYRLGNLLQDDLLLKRAKEISYDTLRRKSFKNSGVNNMYMCHGSTGVAQLYKRIYEQSNDPIFAKSYEFWVNITFDYFRQEIVNDLDADDLNLLSGYLSPMLLLHSYVGNCDSNWDRIFLLS